ncbi:MAG: response regulator [Desulfovibrio sp.]|jgi:signal transduction histidine kinase/CheY-like chemotaxis protein|nr:response regulator [Desulfovibrio sp.]
MSIRIRAVLTIVIISVIIILFGIGSGLFFVQSYLEKSIASDMTAVADVADKFVSSQIDLLKSDVSEAAQQLFDSSDEDLQRVLQKQVEAHETILALTVFDRNGEIVRAYGTAPMPAELVNSDYVQRAFAGEEVISTTRQDSSGKLVLYVCLPMGKGVISATVSGMFFSDLLSTVRIWDTGHLFILDAEGTILANIRPNWVLERYNFIDKAKTDSRYADIAATASRMIKGERGSGRFTVEGKERLCVYVPITGSKVGWTLAVVAPLGESPIHDVRNGLLLVGLVCLLLSVGAAFVASAILERPYETIKGLVATLEAKGKLLYTINEAAAILLGTETDNFADNIHKCLEMVARCAGVDRMRIWKNYTMEGELYCSQLYGWSEGEYAQEGENITRDVRYRDDLHGWEQKLVAGQSINSIAGAFSPKEQATLSAQGIFSILVIPVFCQESFWGFVCFHDCRKERIFSEDDENLLRSGGMLIVNAILRNEMTHDLVRAREEALASAEVKGDFLANMSHEMRTPLNAIIGLSELTLDSGEVEGIARENLEKVYSSGVSLLTLINDILDISKIEAGKFDLIPVIYSTPSLINDTSALNIVRIGVRPLAFHLDIDGTIPSRLFGDELRVKQIFNNLLSNAFKYTMEGRVDWSISCEQDGDDVWLVSCVKDSGIGIRPEDIKKLFSEYNQVDTKSNRRIEGTGLGLSICKSLVEKMDGTIDVVSEYGKGSTFTVRIRQGRVNCAPIGVEVAENLKNFHFSEHKRDRSAKLVRKQMPYARVLVVDDVPTNLDVARGMMKPYGMQIDCASSGPAAIELIRKAEVTYNAIFMDHMMPGMDGMEATRIIREEIGTEYAKNIPVIALTANAIVGNEEMFLRNGFQAFLAKPIDIMRMDIVINHWIRNKDLEEKFSAGMQGDQNTLDRRGEKDRRSGIERRNDLDRRQQAGGLSSKGLDFEQGLKRFGGDEEIYLDVLQSYAQNTPSLLEQLRGCTRESLPDYAIVVHGLKSSSLSIGAEKIGALAKDLEFAAKAGDFAFVDAKNNELIGATQILLAALSAMLRDIAAENPKPQKAEPDAEVLAALQQACESFDIDEVDKAMEELESYAYESCGELVEWLRSQVNVLGFKQIAERLEQK